MWRSRVLGRPDGLGEGAADLDRRLRANWLDWLGEAAGRLIQTLAEFGTKAQRQGRTRLRQQITHSFKTEDMKIVDQTGRQRQCCDRQRLDIARSVPRLRHWARPRIEAREGMSCAPGIGNGGAGTQPHAGELLDQDREHGGLSSVQMIGTGSVDDDSVRRIGGDDWGEALQHPEREPVQRLAVRGRIGVLDHQAPHERLSLARGHADAQSGGLGCRIRSHDHPPCPILAHQN
jgi:hypothetical protein